jgi:hypothetical protein
MTLPLQNVRPRHARRRHANQNFVISHRWNGPFHWKQHLRRPGLGDFNG